MTTATVSVYPDGVNRADITGWIVREWTNGGVTVEDERGIRWTAYGERVKRDRIVPTTPGTQGPLWQ